jgi:hypothetical protein
MPRLHMSAATLTTLVTALACRSPDALPAARPEPTRSHDGGPADESGRVLEALDAATERPLGLVVDHPTELELASLRGTVDRRPVYGSMGPPLRAFPARSSRAPAWSIPEVAMLSIVAEAPSTASGSRRSTSRSHPAMAPISSSRRSSLMPWRASAGASAAIHRSRSTGPRRQSGRRCRGNRGGRRAPRRACPRGAPRPDAARHRRARDLRGRSVRGGNRRRRAATRWAGRWIEARGPRTWSQMGCRPGERRVATVGPPCVRGEVPVRTADISGERRACGAPTPPWARSGVCCSAVGEG